MTEASRITVERKSVFHAVKRKRFGRSTCFLCGRRLGTTNRSDEHVIPKWVQRRFELWDQELILLNRTAIPYRRLTIPCCKPCNNDHLGKIEREVEASLKLGFDAVKSLPPTILFLWLGKIFYGLLMREYFLRADQRNPRKGSIVGRALLDRYDLHHTFLQAARLPIEFMPSIPATVVVFPLKCPMQTSGQFDLRDSLQLMTISVRLGDVGILAALQDGRAHHGLAREYQNRFAKKPLHPLQFQELTAHFFYSASLLNRTPKFIVAENANSVQVHQLPLGGMSSKPVFDPWDSLEYANTLSVFTGIPIADIFEPPDRVLSYLGDGEGEVPEIDFESAGVFDRLREEPG